MKKSNQAILNKLSPHWGRLCAVLRSISNSSEWLRVGSCSVFGKYTVPHPSVILLCFLFQHNNAAEMVCSPKWPTLMLSTERWPPVCRRLQYHVYLKMDVNNEVLQRTRSRFGASVAPAGSVSLAGRKTWDATYLFLIISEITETHWKTVSLSLVL